MDHITKCKIQNYIKLLIENIGQNLHELGCGDEFWDIKLRAQFIREKNIKLDSMKRKVIYCDKIFVKYVQ